ncbi:Kinesin-like protein KIN-10A [Arabidopsis thaliana]|jgi:flagellar biosynthesis GTPase FlhF|uniref:Kinesin-like protein KIN-10A n=4 Tax=Arabidopsis TaxID=3701 RepID=KN10A_ARATH|nr:P-loop containing nucleoside triphosphate hydrolases superfamily protein [Arabidopsis thaliana]Q8VWI7.1 RecName: Full=Kinesin-like protein KIN-10A; AltName: Full=Phragmoplast-associated kinesin-related protein 2; Short=AtPAKRP2 [Arabidopsis thaliana]KAG7615932.1 P-loop containing nucleoside triphosphate hydrolase [Arabidopsis thaliana x Arabidopsis arenosa]KAG7620421.1 P-loop containing nucleoside triphosphate hydrolase [Arabidopsis suecica]AAL32293.1 phragmoplast-associated kinesin-related |eukprot:NP_567426.1 P-loop containing nucleoside triphosphate hydrolases superfamily protein [Arabidopsis thaliana]
MAPTPSSSRSNQTQYTLIRTPQTKQRLNFHSKTPNPDGSKDPSPPEHPVEVIGRIRDYPDRKEKSPSILQVNTDNQTVRVRADVGYRDFTLDGVSFSEQEGLEEFYKKFIEERIKGVKVGNKCTIMMYGPTGAGKSHTMFGCGKEPGIVYRSLRDILGDSDQDGVTFVQVTVLEVYNEEIYDLLSTNSSNNLGIGWPKGASTKVRLEVMGKKAKNASFISGTEAGKISKEIVKVEKRRIVKSTLCNERSSRSHCIIILDVPTVGGRLMLVDMAGSENIDQAGQTGFEAKMQTAKINQGNIALKRVVESIANGDSHVPFRDSKLTMLLQDSFEDDKSKILMILCASPDPKEMHKTLCTLEYGAKAKCIVRGSHTPNKDKYGGDESASAVILGSRIAAMDEFIIKLQSEKKQKEKERNEAQKQLKKKEEEVAALRSLLTQREACATNEEEIKEKVNERTQLLKSELDKKLEECRRMAEEFVEMERRRMEERIVQQQEELEMMRRRLEEIEVEFRRSNGGSVDETSGFAKRLRSLYSDDDPGMVKSMDLDMGDPEPVKQVWGAVSHQSSNTISSNFTNLLQPKPSENMLTQMYPDRVCLSTVFEEEEVEEEEEKVIVEDKSICLITTPMPSLNSEGLGKENCFNGADDKESASSRRLRIQNIFTLCGNQRELSQHSGQEEDQANIASPDKKDNQFFSITNKAEALAVEEAKENNISVDQRENGQLDIYVKWETAADNPRKLITTLRVTKDATLADLRKLIEIYLGSDNQAFTFLKLGEPCGAQVAKEKESTVQATSLPLCNGHAYLATLRPGKSSQHKSLQPASPLPLNPIENMMEVTPISKVTPNHQVDEFSSPNLVAHLSSTPFITLRRH